MEHPRFWDKQIPSLLGITIIVLGLSVTTFLVNKQTFIQTHASDSTQPQDVRISNITDNSFTVSYKTYDATNGFINYGVDSSLGQTAFDDRDLSQKIQNHIIHSITLKNLEPQTNYYFSITSGKDTYLNNNNNFEVTTAPIVYYSTTTNEISGKIILPDAAPPKEAIVYVTSANSQTISALVTFNGIYKINLNHFLNGNLAKLVDLSKRQVMQMLVLDNNKTSNITFYYSKSEQLPIITLSNSYDFRSETQGSASPSASLGRFPSINSKPVSKNKTLQILIPEQNQTYSNPKPIINGTATPNQKIQIMIHSQEQINASVTTDTNGNWQYQPESPLSPGKHTITATTKDATGTIKTITKNFIVSTVGAITVTTPTIIPTKKIAYSPTPTTNKNQLLQVGNTSIITAGIVGLLITIVGGLIFLLSRK